MKISVTSWTLFGIIEFRNRRKLFLIFGKINYISINFI